MRNASQSPVFSGSLPVALHALTTMWKGLKSAHTEVVACEDATV